MALPRIVSFHLIFAGLAAFALAACDQAAPLDSAPLHGAAIGGDFALVGQDGKVHRWSDFKGHWRIVYFGYTYCPDICPTDVQRLSQGLEKFEQDEPKLGANVQPIFVTVDPARDTPEVLGQFVSHFHPRLIGLTGTPEQIADAAKKFGVFYSRGEEGAGGGYAVNHSSSSYLFDPEGEPVAVLPVDEGAEAVTDELKRWVR